MLLSIRALSERRHAKGCLLRGRRQPVECKIARRNINNLRYADDTTLMAEVKRN